MIIDLGDDDNDRLPTVARQDTMVVVMQPDGLTGCFRNKKEPNNEEGAIREAAKWVEENVEEDSPSVILVCTIQRVLLPKVRRVELDEVQTTG